MLTVQSATDYVTAHFNMYGHTCRVNRTLEQHADKGPGAHTVTVWFDAVGPFANDETYSGNMVVWVECNRLYGEW